MNNSFLIIVWQALPTLRDFWAINHAILFQPFQISQFKMKRFKWRMFIFAIFKSFRLLHAPAIALSSSRRNCTRKLAKLHMHWARIWICQVDSSIFQLDELSDDWCHWTLLFSIRDRLQRRVFSLPFFLFSLCSLARLWSTGFVQWRLTTLLYWTTRVH